MQDNELLFLRHRIIQQRDREGLAGLADLEGKRALVKQEVRTAACGTGRLHAVVHAHSLRGSGGKLHCDQLRAATFTGRACELSAGEARLNRLRIVVRDHECAGGVVDAIGGTRLHREGQCLRHLAGGVINACDRDVNARTRSRNGDGRGRAQGVVRTFERGAADGVIYRQRSGRAAIARHPELGGASVLRRTIGRVGDVHTLRVVIVAQDQG